MPSTGDVLRALAEEALERGIHPDRESVLRDYVGEDTDQGPEPTEGQGPGGEGGKPRTERDAEAGGDESDKDQAEEPGGDKGEKRRERNVSPTTQPDTASGSQGKGRTGK
jgi:hypothetical protein